MLCKSCATLRVSLETIKLQRQKLALWGDYWNYWIISLCYVMRMLFRFSSTRTMSCLSLPLQTWRIFLFYSKRTKTRMTLDCCISNCFYMYMHIWERDADIFHAKRTLTVFLYNPTSPNSKQTSLIITDRKLPPKSIMFCDKWFYYCCFLCNC